MTEKQVARRVSVAGMLQEFHCRDYSQPTWPISLSFTFLNGFITHHPQAQLMNIKEKKKYRDSWNYSSHYVHCTVLFFKGQKKLIIRTVQ